MLKLGASNVTDTLGALEIGVLISTLLYGVTCGQVYLYATQSNRRPPILNLMVALVMTLESIHLVFMWIYFFDITITNFENPLAVACRATWTYGIMLGAHALLVTIIELFFCYRVWVLSSWRWIAFVPALGSIVRGQITLTLAGVDMTFGIRIFHDKTSAELFYFDLILSAVVDFWITASLYTFLWDKTTGDRRIKKSAAAIVRRTLDTGIFITITAMLILAVSTVLPFTGYWNGLLMIYPRLYANSFLTSVGSIPVLDTAEFVLVTNADFTMVAPSAFTQVADLPYKQAPGQVHAGDEKELGDDYSFFEMTLVDVEDGDLGLQKIHGGLGPRWSQYTL